jgi:hypothetical protein
MPIIAYRAGMALLCVRCTSEFIIGPDHHGPNADEHGIPLPYPRIRYTEPHWIVDAITGTRLHPLHQNEPLDGIPVCISCGDPILGCILSTIGAQRVKDELIETFGNILYSGSGTRAFQPVIAGVGERWFYGVQAIDTGNITWTGEVLCTRTEAQNLAHAATLSALKADAALLPAERTRAIAQDIIAAYPEGVCPACATAIPPDVTLGASCTGCEHIAFSLEHARALLHGSKTSNADMVSGVTPVSAQEDLVEMTFTVHLRVPHIRSAASARRLLPPDALVRGENRYRLYRSRRRRASRARVRRGGLHRHDPHPQTARHYTPPHARSAMNIPAAIKHLGNAYQSEARAIAECISDALEDVPEEERNDHAIAMADAFIDWAGSFKAALVADEGKSLIQFAFTVPTVDDGLEVVSALQAESRTAFDSEDRANLNDVARQIQKQAKAL